MSSLVDRYLLFRIRTKRDPEAFGKIYDRCVQPLYRFILLKVPSKEEAQDITAETFTKTWNYLQSNQEVTHLRALLYRIARNLIADFYRYRPPVVSLDAVTSEPFGTSTQVPDALDDRGRGKEMIEARAEFKLILQHLEKLKEDYRDVVTLRLVDELPFDDIAEILEKTSGNVRVMYHRALNALKDLE